MESDNPVEEASKRVLYIRIFMKASVLFGNRRSANETESARQIGLALIDYSGKPTFFRRTFTRGSSRMKLNSWRLKA